MKTTKTVWHSFDCSAFDEELGYLNAMSEQGWQLADADMRPFTWKFVRDDSVVYRYAVDYRYSFDTGEFPKYRAEFEDQGWTYVTRRSDWYFFRKPYDPSLPEEEYLIYTDEPSFRDMKRTVGLIVNFTGIMYLPLLLMRFNIIELVIAAMWVYAAVGSICRQRRLKRVRRVPRPYRRHFWRYSLLIIVLLGALAFALIPAMAETMDFRMEGPTTGTQTGQLTVKLPLFFALETRTDAAYAPTCAITDESGRAVFSGVLDPSGEKTNVCLGAGRYTLTVDWGGGDGGTAYVLRVTDISLIRELPLYVTNLWMLGWAALFILISVRQKRGSITFSVGCQVRASSK